MSVAAVEPCHKRSTGFTIDSIIGKQNEKSEKGEFYSQKKNGDIFSNELKDEKHTPSLRDKPGTLSDTVRKTRDGDLTPPTEQESDLRDIMFRHHHATESLKLLHNHSPDSLKHIQNQDSLKHLHEVLAQTAGATGTYFPPRVCRHPLSTLNLHSMYPSHLPQSTPVHPLVINPANRDVRSLHPWMSDRYSGYYYPRYPVSAAPGFLFQPYRKPKRIRTAFSPSQLLQLERSFEKSHYVVGQERKDLAAELQLTETQVKVWFQNRRTKHKRMKAEEDGGGGDGEMSVQGQTCSSPDISDMSDHNEESDDEEEVEISVDRNT